MPVNIDSYAFNIVIDSYAFNIVSECMIESNYLRTGLKTSVLWLKHFSPKY